MLIPLDPDFPATAFATEIADTLIWLYLNPFTRTVGTHPSQLHHHRIPTCTSRSRSTLKWSDTISRQGDKYRSCMLHSHSPLFHQGPSSEQTVLKSHPWNRIQLKVCISYALYLFSSVCSREIEKPGGSGTNCSLYRENSFHRSQAFQLRFDSRNAYVNNGSKRL